MRRGTFVPAATALVVQACCAHDEREWVIDAKNKTGESDEDRFNTLLRQKGCLDMVARLF